MNIAMVIISLMFALMAIIAGTVALSLGSEVFVRVVRYTLDFSFYSVKLITSFVCVAICSFSFAALSWFTHLYSKE